MRRMCLTDTVEMDTQTCAMKQLVIYQKRSNPQTTGRPICRFPN